jgi:hypothetical protein
MYILFQKGYTLQDKMKERNKQGKEETRRNQRKNSSVCLLFSVL